MSMLGLEQVVEANRKETERFLKLKQQRDARTAAKKAWKENHGE